MSYLTRASILEAPDLRYEDVEVPEWGGMVRVRGLTGADRDAFESSVVQQNGRKASVSTQNIRAKLVARAIVNERDDRVFSDADVEALGAKSAQALDRVFAVAQRLSGLTAADVEELSKN